MKTSTRLRTLFVTAALLPAILATTNSQTVQLSIGTSGTNLQISAVPSADYLTNNYSGVVFTISWPSSYNVSLGTVATLFGIKKAGLETVSGAYKYQKFYYAGDLIPISWPANVQQLLMTIPVAQTGAGSGAFALREAGFAPGGDPYIEIDGIDHTNNAAPFFNQITEVALPVELTSFTVAMDKFGATLIWKTATENNNAGFDIERTAAGPQVKKEWTKIGFVEGSGTCNSPKQYSFRNKSLQTGTYTYRLKQIDRDGGFQYSPEVDAVVAAPREFALSQNYPNPFNPTTTINFALAEDSRVMVKIYDIVGREAAVLIEGDLTAGYFDLPFDGRELASGVYLYRITAKYGETVFTQTKRLMLLK